METQKLEPKPKEEECPHIPYKIIDSGMLLVGEGGRDIGLSCEDCGLIWDIRLYRGSSKATIGLRQSGAEKYDSSIDLLKSFIAHLEEHQIMICFYDDFRRKAQDKAMKGFYPISYDKDSIELRLESFLKELNEHDPHFCDT